MSHILDISGVNKTFGGLHALADINLKVEEGTIHAIIGPNGAGKSTLLNCCIGRLVPDTGTVTFNGRNMIGMQPWDINHAGMVRVFQTPEIFPDLPLLQNVMIPALAKREGTFKFNPFRALAKENELREKAMEALADVGLDRYHVEPGLFLALTGFFEII